MSILRHVLGLLSNCEVRYGFLHSSCTLYLLLLLRYLADVLRVEALQARSKPSAGKLCAVRRMVGVFEILHSPASPKRMVGALWRQISGDGRPFRLKHAIPHTTHSINYAATNLRGKIVGEERVKARSCRRNTFPQYCTRQVTAVYTRIACTGCLQTMRILP